MPQASIPYARLLTPGRSNEATIRTVALMGTFVTIQVVGRPADAEHVVAIDRALAWFLRVEECCNRFDAASELRRLSLEVGVAVPVSPMLFEAVRFALAVAEETGGAFDPTVGARMEAQGFNRDYRTGEMVRPMIDPNGAVSYRDVQVDPDRHTVTLARPLIIDLGAVAKGLAIDMAARELAPFGNYAIDAGGDLYLAGTNPTGAPWSVGIRHPRDDDRLLDVVQVSDVAVCTSGDYERPSPIVDGEHHIVDARAGTSADAAVSATVIAPTAMLADALATAVFVLGPVAGIQLLERHGVEGMIVSPGLERFTTPGYPV